MYEKIYYPYPATNKRYKYTIITNQGKKISFGASGYEHYTEGHLDPERKQRYLNRHKTKENWNNPNTAGYWSAKYLWSYPTYKEAYQKIRQELISKGYIST